MEAKDETKGKVYLQICDATFYPGEKHPNASKYRRRLEKEPGIPGVLDLMLLAKIVNKFPHRVSHDT